MLTPFLHPALSPVESVISLTPEPGEPVAGFVRRLKIELLRHEGEVVLAMFYGVAEVSVFVEWELKRAFGRIEFPVMWMDGVACGGEELAGAQLFMVSRGIRVERIQQRSRVVGSVFYDGGLMQCVLGGLTPVEPGLPRAVQCKKLLAGAASMLSEVGFSLADVVRTWFCNDEILSWYDDFNHVRASEYSREPFRSGSVPASTATRGRNRQGAALSLAAWALVPTTPEASVHVVSLRPKIPPSGVPSFNHGIEITTGYGKRLFVSGTVSVDAAGATVWPEEADKQICAAVETVGDLLQSRQFDWGDVVRGTAYFKSGIDLVHFRDCLAARNWTSLPVVPVCCDLCRADLRFSMELDACRAG